MELSSFKGENIRLSGQSKQIEKEFAENETMTEEIEYLNRGMNTRPLKQAETQVELPKNITKDSGNVLEFLQKIENLMSKELKKTTKAFQCNIKLDYQVDWKQDSPPALTHTFLGPKVEEMKKTQPGEDYFNTGLTERGLSASSVSWNCKGFTLAVGYSYLGHTGWCDHKSFVRTWGLSNMKLSELEVEGCISAVRFSPLHPSILAIGSYNGILMICNLETGEIISRSSIDEYQHREAITGILWLSTSQYSIFTISTDGKVLNWSQDNLEFPVRGMLIKGKKELEGGNSFDVTEDQSGLIIGSESGKVLKFNIPTLASQPLPVEGYKIKPTAELVLNNLNPTYRQQLLKSASKYCLEKSLKEIDINAIFFNKPDILKCYPSSVYFRYESHDGPITGVCCNPFHRNLFASSSNDGTIKVFNGLNSKANIVLEPVVACKVFAIAWSEVRPLVLAAGSENGSVYVYDFLQSKTHFVLEIPSARNCVASVVFSKAIKDYLAVAYRSGETRVYQLPEIFAAAHPDENRRLGLLLENALYE
jgi:WD repeat-containing protein 34